MAEMVHKVTLSSDREVLLRSYKIKHEELAAQSLATKTDGENAITSSLLMQKEILKLLIVQVDGKSVSAAQMESLDDVFSYKEYRECLTVVKELMGGDSEAPKVEIVSFGD